MLYSIEQENMSKNMAFCHSLDIYLANRKTIIGYWYKNRNKCFKYCFQKVIHKTAEATGELIANKIADKVVKQIQEMLKK